MEIVSSHNDVNPNNMLFQDGRLWLVDWESAFAADRYVDLGALANFLQLDAVREVRLLSDYFGAEAQPPADRIAWRWRGKVARLFYSAVLLPARLSERPGFSVDDGVLAP